MNYRFVKGILVGALFFVTSCDPACDETIKIVNNTEVPLIFVVEKKGSFKDTSTYYYQYHYDYRNTSELIGDSLLIVECELKSGFELILLYYGPLGTISMSTKEDGKFLLNEISDTIYLKNQNLLKDINELNNWEFYVNSYKNGGGESIFSFSISNEDIE